jgi:valyl-tRNA synthetase
MELSKTYNSQEVEKRLLKFWEKEKIYKFNPRKKGKIFSIDTPPPTVSGKMHLGHSFSYTHVDIIARFHSMKGENVFYPFGTDDNGLPTEKLVEKENKVKIFQMKRNEFVELCQKTIKELRPEFIQGWKNLGMSCDFNLMYSTIDKRTQKLSQKFFIELYKKNRVYQKQAPTLWCPQCQTAIAQADLEDKERKSFLVHIKVKIIGTNNEIVFATTRPELLPACVGISVHPDDKRYKKFIGKKALMPISNKEIPIIADEKTDKEYGTGVVYYCTYGGIECIDWMTRHSDIKPIHIMGQNGKFNEKAGKYSGMNSQQARKQIIEDLNEIGAMVKQEPITHTVNTHERCGFDVEFIATKQWFIKYLDLKQDFIDLDKKIKWFPEYMRKRYENWAKGLKWDWCISRQRYFGIPFPLWFCSQCGKVKLAEISDLPIDPLVSQPKTKCSCGNNKFIPEKDILDTWATSSLTPQIAIDLIKDEKIKKKMFPMSLRPQAHDIINFWLFYTLARSKLHFNKIPWKEVMVSGFVLDPKREKMSKSKGNVIAPDAIIEEYGVDVLRHWAAKASLGDDLRFDQEELRASKRTVIKLWNASSFCFLHLKSTVRCPTPNNLQDEDKWILHLLQETIKNYNKHLEKYELKNAKNAIETFFWKNFCDNYLEIVKPRLYEEGIAENSRNAAKFTLYYCLLSILKLYAPFMPFITEEIFQNYFKKIEKQKSIHLSNFTKLNPKFENLKAKKEIDSVIDIISAIRKYKSDNQMSMKKEIDKLFINSKDRKIQKHFDLIANVMNIENIELKKMPSKIQI